MVTSSGSRLTHSSFCVTFAIFRYFLRYFSVEYNRQINLTDSLIIKKCICCCLELQLHILFKSFCLIFTLLYELHNVLLVNLKLVQLT